MNPQNNAITIDLMSPKHLIGQCLDITLNFLRELVQHYCTKNGYEFPPPNQKNDLIGYIGYITDMHRFDNILDLCIGEAKEKWKGFIKTWLFEIKSIRNAWAHWSVQELDYKLSLRLYDNFCLLYNSLKADKTWEMYLKIELYRKNLLKKVAFQELQGI